MQTPQERRKSAFWAAFWGGIAAPAMLYTSEHPRITRVEIAQRSDRDAMRSDWERIGSDFNHVITRETPAISSKA